MMGVIVAKKRKVSGGTTENDIGAVDSNKVQQVKVSNVITNYFREEADTHHQDQVLQQQEQGEGRGGRCPTIRNPSPSTNLSNFYYFLLFCGQNV